MFDVLMERIGPKIFDKRRNAGPGRGLEVWRILKYDFGTSSPDAQLAKLQKLLCVQSVRSCSLLTRPR